MSKIILLMPKKIILKTSSLIICFKSWVRVVNLYWWNVHLLKRLFLFRLLQRQRLGENLRGLLFYLRNLLIRNAPWDRPMLKSTLFWSLKLLNFFLFLRWAAFHNGVYVDVPENVGRLLWKSLLYYHFDEVAHLILNSFKRMHLTF